MGRTLALSQITDKAAYRYGLPNTLPVDYVPFYKDEASIETSLNALKKHIHRYPGLHGAMCCELIQGEGGFNVGSRTFFRALMEVLKRNDIPIIADEIQTFGRTPKLFAFDHFELRDLVDIVCIGKLSQVCATLFKERVKPGAGLLGQTFTASTSAIKASLAILEGFLKGDYLQKNVACFKECTAIIDRMKKRYPNRIEGPFGIGSMVAFIVDEGNPEKTTRFAKELFHEGLITFTAGGAPMKIRMLIPAPVLKEGDLEKAFAIVEKSWSGGRRVYIVRPAQAHDVDDLYALALKSSLGLTNFPKDKDLLAKMLHDTEIAFQKEIREPHDELYIFCMERVLDHKVIGSSMIYARIPYKTPLPYFLRYPQEKWDMLHAVFDDEGASELCGLYVDPDIREEGLGKLISVSRFFFIADHLKRFMNKLFADIHGYVDPEGNCTFWDGVMRPFFKMTFKRL